MITNSTSFELKSDNGNYAVITLLDLLPSEENGDRSATGIMQIFSTYGSWCFNYSGCSIREYLLSSRREDVANRMTRNNDGDSRYLYFENTVALFTNEIYKMRRVQEITKDQAREYFNDLEDIEETNNVDAFCTEIFKSSLSNIPNWFDLVQVDIHPRVYGFLDTFLEPICSYINAEKIK